MTSDTRKMSNRRIRVLLLGIIFIFFLLVVRLFFLQVLDTQDIQEKAAGQWTRSTVVSASRGRILDRDGKVLAQSTDTTYITADPQVIEENEDLTPRQIAEMIAGIIDIDVDTIAARLADTTKASVTIARQVKDEDVTAIRKLSIKGLYYSADTGRLYPRNNVLSQVLGFTNIDNEGQTGIELLFDKYLRGEDGEILTAKDRRGRVLVQKPSDYVEPDDGYDVVLTIDYTIQSFAQTAAERCMEETGAKSVMVMAMDVNTGELLANVILPDFDLNNPPRNDISLLNSVSRLKTITDSYEPGSTFKILTTAAALESGTVSQSSTFNCYGHVMVDGDKIGCWRSYNPHGHQSLAEVLQNSCNPAFVQMALGMGRETFYDYLQAFGLGQKTGIELSGEAAGQLIAEKYVKDVDLARIGFGQSVAVTPIQMLTAACSAVNGGNLYKPYVVKEIVNSKGETALSNAPTLVGNPISEDTSAIMRELLESVVRDGGGRNAYVPGYRIGGKTGTAQKYVDGVISSTAHIGSFIGFAPIDDPQVAVLVICDEPTIRPDYGSTVAAPYAGMLLENILQHMSIEPVYAQGDVELVGKTTTLRDVVGMSVENACAALDAAGLRYMIDGNGDEVTQTVPYAGQTVKAGSLVLLYCDKEETEISDPLAEPKKEKTFVPELIGMGMVEANRTLEDYGLEMKITGKGSVVRSQSPEAGTVVEMGSKVTLEFYEP